jgi:hypothetical protein
MWLLIGLFEGKIIVMQETLLMIMCRSSAGSFLHSEKRDEKRLVCELRIVDGVWLLSSIAYRPLNSLAAVGASRPC